VDRGGGRGGREEVSQQNFECSRENLHNNRKSRIKQPIPKIAVALQQSFYLITTFLSIIERVKNESVY
jgi:hypothetical protein